ncbi:condensation domain-containing protein, partial [Streptomyces sp. KLOTTS4A1]|uniref:condensation domain-containing protein n=1 Tax=Streptomyces sp. KLOTTS4A1 TaxID=3390996 RepID=UPI0039F44D23
VVARHEALRTVFPAVNGIPQQDIRTATDAQTELAGTIEITEVTSAQLEDALNQAARHSFALESELPLRVTLFRVDGARDVLLFLMHHIVADGWSTGPLLHDLTRAYTSRHNGTAPDWTELEVQYADYTLWQQEVLGSEDDPDSLLNQQLTFWHDQLTGIPELIELPLDHPRPALATHTGDTV